MPKISESPESPPPSDSPKHSKIPGSQSVGNPITPSNDCISHNNPTDISGEELKICDSEIKSKNYDFRKAVYEKTIEFAAKQIESNRQCCLAKYLGSIHFPLLNGHLLFSRETQFLPIKVIAAVETRLKNLADDLTRRDINPPITRNAKKILNLIDEYKKTDRSLMIDITIIPKTEMRKNQVALLAAILNILGNALEVDGSNITMKTEFSKPLLRHEITQECYVGLIQLIKGCLEYEAFHEEALNTIIAESKTKIIKPLKL